MQQLTTIQTVVIWILPVLFAITVHEVAHGYVAYLLGDKTAKILGRLTLNPLKHIDIVGTILVPLVLLLTSGMILGWAKPVPITSRNLSKPRRDLAYISIAGPAANFVMALLWGGVAKLASVFPGVLAIRFMGEAGISINVALMILNLLPLPPLDGGRFVECLLPGNIGAQYGRIAPYGFMILLVLLMTDILFKIIFPPIAFIIQQIYMLYGL